MPAKAESMNISFHPVDLSSELDSDKTLPDLKWHMVGSMGA